MPWITEDSQPSGTLTIIYSDPGLGKTLLAAGMMYEIHRATGRKAAYCDLENGRVVIPEGAVPMDPWAPNPKNDIIDEMMGFGMDVQKKLPPLVVVDTTSTFGIKLLRSVSEKNIKADKGEDTKRPTFTTTGKTTVTRATQNDYAMAQTCFLSWAQLFDEPMAKGVHVLWLAHQQVYETKDAGGAVKDVIGAPDTVSAKLARSMPRATTMIFRIRTGIVDSRVSRFLQVDTDGFYMAKDRLRVLPPTGKHIGVNPFMGDGKTPKPENKFIGEVMGHGASLMRAIMTKTARVAKEKIEEPAMEATS